MAAEIKIHLRYNVESGKKDIIIEYDSEDDALPYEHEARHKEIVEQLLGHGVLAVDEVGQITVARLDKGESEPPKEESEGPAQVAAGQEG